MRVLAAAFLCSLHLVTVAHCQERGQRLAPKEDHLAQAHQMCREWFGQLEEGKTEEFARSIKAHLGTGKSPADQIQMVTDTKSRLDILLAGPPTSAWGPLVGYDLLDESFLPGTSRYFRLTYISYHTEAPLLWELRWYVKPDDDVCLQHITWSDVNPFEYLATMNMLFPNWYRD